MGKPNLQFLPSSFWNLNKINKFFKGFTLIELLVVIAMVGVMISFLLIFINPFKQIQKARDAQREQNLKQVNNALDTYYNDNNCYPAPSVFSFGGTFEIGSTVYMKQVPQDPDCSAGGSCYAYVVDPSSCPQWNVLFAKVYSKPNSTISCPLEQFSSCVPSNYSQEGYNYCVLSGEVDCTYINGLTLPSGGGFGSTPTPTPGGPTATPGPTNTPTPTSSVPPATPTPTCSPKNYSCTGSPLRCNIVAPAGSGQYCTSNCDGNCP